MLTHILIILVRLSGLLIVLKVFGIEFVIILALDLFLVLVVDLLRRFGLLLFGFGSCMMLASIALRHESRNKTYEEQRLPLLPRPLRRQYRRHLRRPRRHIYSKHRVSGRS
jgi:hypothetical protein